LRTHDNGRAEIEFEDGSTLRLTPNTTVLFSTLGSSDAGKHLSEVNLVEGMAYVNWLGKDQIALNFSHEKVSLDHSAHFRVGTSSEAAKVAVFKGDVSVESPSGTVAVAKKKTATLDLPIVTSSPLPTMSKKLRWIHGIRKLSPTTTSTLRIILRPTATAPAI